jgi:hypothetical protein
VACLAWLCLAPRPTAASPSPPTVIFTEGDHQGLVAAPPGWVLERRPPGAVPPEFVLHPAGSSAGRAERTMSVRVVPRPDAEGWDRHYEALKPFEKDRVRRSFALTERTGDGRSATVWRFVADDGQPSHSVAVIEEDRVLVLLISEASSLKSLQDGAEELRALVGAYRVERMGLRGTLERAWARWDDVAWGLAGMAFPALMLCGISWLLALAGGWPFLARVYPARRGFDGEVRRVRGFVGSGGYEYLTVGADDTGLYLRNVFLLRMGHRPLFIPWPAVKDVTTVRGGFWSRGPHLDFRLRGSKVTVRLPPALEPWLKEAAGPAWPGGAARPATTREPLRGSAADAPGPSGPPGAGTAGPPSRRSPSAGRARRNARRGAGSRPR